MMNVPFTTTTLTRTGRSAVALLAFTLTAALGALAPRPAQAQFPFNSIYSFFGTDGEEAVSNLFQASDGNLYGTTVLGGKGIGTVYRISTTGAEDVIHVFGNTAGDGSQPNAVIQASDGNVYGTTSLGGSNNKGTAFKMGLDNTYTIIHDFGSASGDAIQPVNNTALLEAGGELYGVASSTTQGGLGAIYAMTFGGVTITLHAFTGGSSDGSAPSGTPILASNGNIYGAAALGGPSGAGVIYKMSGSGFLHESLLYAFKGGTSDGKSPSVLIQASDGNLYGITQQGGASNNGTVFKLTLSGTETILHSFAGGASDGSSPTSLFQGADGKLYGVCRFGGAHSEGMAFRMSLSGSETLLYSFGSSTDDPGQPLAMMQDSDGHFYGIGLIGGVSGEGSVFTMTTSGTESLLHSFPTNSGIDPSNPNNGLMQAANGNFYGVTYQGGIDNKGTVFQITPDGHQSILHSFSGNPDGANPFGVLVQDSSGTLYGVTNGGGANGNGAIFKVTTGGVETILHSFNGSDGAAPLCGLTPASDGNLYGACFEGGSTGRGTIFKITPAGVFTLLYTFKGGTSDGAGPNVLMQASDGNLYGTTFEGGPSSSGFGSIFKITTAGVETPLYFFTGGNDGNGPVGGLVQGPDGNLYGAAEYGANGISSTNPGFGAIFQITLSGTFRVLYDFNGSQVGDGANPGNTLVFGPDGDLYGTTVDGGTNNDGVVFEASRFGFEQIVHEFNGVDGQFPGGPLLLASDSNFYGLTGAGGFNNDGTVFMVVPPFANPVPVLSSISPSKTGAGGPAFTLTVTGSNFLNNSTVDWNGTALTTTFVSQTELTATVPASDIATPGTAAVTVVNPAPGGGASNSLTFTIAVTTVGLKAASLVKNSDGSYTATITLKNTGFHTASSAKITKSSLGSAVTTTSLPVSLGNIAAGAAVTAHLHYPASAGMSGTVVNLAVSVAFTGGSSNSSLSVTLP
ncbi:MAG TPA: choice-of-anchor tandem repeat GloVer-containing protein [Chthonomonadaceae bacterium]|nr:choice-of-anchor tandem repeat GloVer-containing protein [Chthonomonadaceae bacterium]